MDDFRIPGIVLMENAARGIADALRKRFSAPTGPISIVCGPGNNGGDGFACARHLTNAGLSVTLHLAAAPDAYRDGSDAKRNLEIAIAMGIPRKNANDLADAAVIVDAVFGTGLVREISEPYRGIIEAINAAPAPTVAVDLPSGLDADTGAIHGVAVCADLTVTMVAEKVGFALGEGPAHIGDVEVVDIGAPREAIERVLATDREQPTG